jgi:hypothetical protein
LGRALFVLTHFRTLYFTSNLFFSCLFPSIMDDIHIISPLQSYHPHMNISRLNFMR